MPSVDALPEAPAEGAPDGEPIYVLGRTDAETRRLMLQAELYSQIMRRFLEDAGVAAGMKMLDVGSGAGDVAFAAAEIVGPSGEVIGIDTNATVLERARERAVQEQRENVTFVAVDCRTAEVGDGFDAAVGRFVLMYNADVAATLQAVTDRVRPGGVVAFAEADFTSVLGYVPAGPSELIRSIWTWGVEAFRQAGVHTAMAPQLYYAFVAAGLGEPRMFLHASLGCHEEWPGYGWAAESMRSHLPLMEQFGIVTARELGVETLTERFQADVVRTHFPFMTIPMVAAWARKPAG